MRLKQRSMRARGTLAGGVALLVAGCQFPVPENKSPPADATRVCEPASHVCTGGVATHCSDDGTSSTTETCTFGCATTNDRCADLDPSNGLAAQLDEARTADPLVLTGDAVIDTTAGTITNGDGRPIAHPTVFVDADPVDILVVPVRTMTAANVEVHGSRALAIMADGDVTILGTLSVSATAGKPGPGSLAGVAGCDGYLYAVCSDPFSFTGGGGGGFGAQGGASGNCNSRAGVQGGGPYGNPLLVPLHGGCIGGNGGQRSAPGRGGGAVQISSRGQIRLANNAYVTAHGAGGHSPTPFPDCLGGALPCSNGAGGGSGGAVLLEAAMVVFDAGSGLFANGGSGHLGVAPPANASDGQNGTAPSPAFIGCPGCTPGGQGGALGAEAMQGGSALNAAGGGGSVGRLRINVARGASPDLARGVFSPSPTVGTTLTR